MAGFDEGDYGSTGNSFLNHPSLVSCARSYTSRRDVPVGVSLDLSTWSEKEVPKCKWNAG